MSRWTSSMGLGSLLAILIAAGGCSDVQPLAPDTGGVSLSANKTSPGPAHVEGEIGPGANYELDLPADWNGRLIAFAHGYRNPMDPVQEDPSAQVSAIRDALLAKGFGFAWTSYSENGFAVKDGGQRVHQLRGLWNSNFGKPDRTYLVGQSMGALVALQLAEKYPGIYAGALPYCGMIGGSEFEARFVFDVRVLFDYYFPGVLPGDVLSVPQGTDFSALVPAIIGSLAANPLAALEMAGVDQIELRFNDFNELVAAVLSPLGFHTIGVNDVLERTHGRNPIDNTNTIYTGSSNDAALNAGVDRFLAAPDAKNYLSHWYEPTGRLKVPVLTLHTSRDPLAPFSNEVAYAGIVSAAGKSELLLQRTVDRFGHCTFAIAEIVAALEALVGWAETGVKPAG